MPSNEQPALHKTNFSLPNQLRFQAVWLKLSPVKVKNQNPKPQGGDV